MEYWQKVRSKNYFAQVSNSTTKFLSVLFIVLLPYLLIPKPSCLQKNNFGHTRIAIALVQKFQIHNFPGNFLTRCQMANQILSSVESEILVLGLITICVEFKITCDNQECVKCHHHGYWLKKKCGVWTKRAFTNYVYKIWRFLTTYPPPFTFSMV